MRWVINVPVWGQSYVERWLVRGYPAIIAALQHDNWPQHRWIIHTDMADLIAAAMDHTDLATVKFFPPVIGFGSCDLGRADRDGFHDTAIGEATVFLNADMVPSIEIFKRCEEIFNSEHEEGRPPRVFVSCPSIRTNDIAPPIGADGIKLANWAWRYRHIFTEDCVWRRGGCKLPPYMIFDSGANNIVMHAFDLQPLAILKTKFFELTSPTASEIIQHFSPDEIYVVKNSNEMVIAEPCKPDIEYARFVRRPYSHRDVIAWAKHSFCCKTQQRQFLQQIVLIGEFDPAAQNIAYRIYEGLFRPSAPLVLAPTFIGVIKLGLKVPPRIRHMIPKSIREWIKNFEWPVFLRRKETGWPHP